jgi:hypothetical protein
MSSLPAGRQGRRRRELSDLKEDFNMEKCKSHVIIRSVSYNEPINH